MQQTRGIHQLDLRLTLAVLDGEQVIALARIAGRVLVHLLDGPEVDGVDADVDALDDLAHGLAQHVGDLVGHEVERALHLKSQLAQTQLRGRQVQ